METREIIRRFPLPVALTISLIVCGTIVHSATPFDALHRTILTLGGVGDVLGEPGAAGPDRRGGPAGPGGWAAQGVAPARRMIRGGRSWERRYRRRSRGTSSAPAGSRAACGRRRAPTTRRSLAGRCARACFARGWRLGEMAYLGLLDPATADHAGRWAVQPREFTSLQERLNPPGAVANVEGKRLFAEICARHGLPTPAIVADLRRSSDRHWTVRDWAETLARDAPQEFFVKPAGGNRGSGVRAATRTLEGSIDFDGTALTWGELARCLADEPWQEMIVQPRLHPHPELAALSGVDVLQTLRIVTLREDGAAARIVWAGLRIATGGVPIDTHSAGATGNVHAHVHDDGRLDAAVGRAPSGFGLVWVREHPLTGTPIAGARVPQWEACRTLALRAADTFAPLRAVGWDVAPTATGVVLVEGNAWWSPLQDPAGGSVPVRDALRQAAARL